MYLSQEQILQKIIAGETVYFLNNGGNLVEFECENNKFTITEKDMLGNIVSFQDTDRDHFNKSLFLHLIHYKIGVNPNKGLHE